MWVSELSLVCFQHSETWKQRFSLSLSLEWVWLIWRYKQREQIKLFFVNKSCECVFVTPYKITAFWRPMAEKQFLVANGVGGVGGAQTSPSLRVCATVSCALHSMARSRTYADQSAGSRLVFEKGLKNAQTGGAGRNSTYFLGWIGGGGGQQARLFVSFFQLSDS